MTASFNPNRLKLARERRGVTITTLAKNIEMTTKIVSMYENGHQDPPPTTLEGIAKCLRFPVEFFYGDDIDELIPETVSFRALTKMKASQRDASIGAARLALQLHAWIDTRFELPSPDLPDLRNVEPEPAAASLRHDWGLGEMPIKNLVHLLESRGVRVFALDEKTRDMDAFSFWHGGVPFVFLNTNKSAEHSRFDAAHELAHLVLHKHGSPGGREAERQADQFASAFLMPRASVIAVAPRFAALDNLVRLKANWTVSVTALVRRLKDVGLISDWHYRNLCIECSRRGFRTQEPVPARRETSQVLNRIFELLREDGVSLHDVARELALPAEEIKTLVFALVVVGLQGGAVAPGRSARPKPSLRLIK